jgi:hypothetical protein
MMNPLAPQITPVRKRPLKIPSKMKTLLTLALYLLAGTAMAMPYDATNQIGDSACKPPKGNQNYSIRYNSSLCGHWELTGHRNKPNPDGTYTDSFRGTVSDTSVNRTFTQADFAWLSDWAWLCPHTARQCTFSLTISAGSVTGFATYTP